jgi:hypothetical protein
MNLSHLRKSAAIGVLALGPLIASVAEANITYSVNRAVGAGSVSGFFETDGTLGILGAANFVNWSITIQASNVNGGIPTSSVFGSGTLSIGSGVLSATANDILFDFGGSDLFFTYTSSGDWWCVAGSNLGCFNPNAESIGYDDNAFNAGQSTPYQGVQSIASVDSNGRVPEPGMLSMIGLALAGLTVMRRRRT